MESKTISFIIPTIGRPSLERTLSSIEKRQGDEILVIKHDPPSNNWGNAERAEGTKKARCNYLAYIDDDDIYTPGHRQVMENAIERHPGLPILFRIKYPSGRILWRKRWVKNGNVSTQMILVPNAPEMLYGWDQYHSWADFWFIRRWAWPTSAIVWRKEIICLMGHDDEKYKQKLGFSIAKREGILR